jgi:type I restriction enzyme S subunit
MGGWRLADLGGICDILDSRRKPITKKDRVPGPYPYYGATGVLDYVEGYLFEEPLILVGEDGAKWGAGENTAFAIEGKCWVNNHAHVLRPNRSILLDSWLIYYLNYSDLMPFITGLTVPKLNQGKLREIPIPLPPLPEQERIVAILDEAFAAVATATADAERNLANARELFQSYLSNLFAPQQSAWGEVELDAICSFSSGGTPSKKNSNYWSGDIPWVSGRDMKSTTLSDATLHVSQQAVDETSTRMAQPGSLLILVRGMGLAHGAQIAELIAPCAFNQDIRSISPQGNIEARYLLFALRTRINMSDHVLSNAAHGTLKISMDALKSVEIPVPSADEQSHLTSQIGDLSECADEVEGLSRTRLTLLTELKQSILHKAFTGELTADFNAADIALSKGEV